MRIKLVPVLSIVAMSLAAPCQAAPIIYAVDFGLHSISFNNLERFTGYIETDGTLGTLSATNITTWFIRPGPGIPFDPSSDFCGLDANPLACPIGQRNFILISPPSLTASGTGLFFDFSNTQNSFFCFGRLSEFSTSNLCFEQGDISYNFASVDHGFSSQVGNVEIAMAPGPISGAGVPGLLAAIGGLLIWRRHRHPRTVN
jgi:hypothetical protein